MGRRAITLLALLAAIVSCTSADSDEATTTTLTDSTTTTVSFETPSDPGRLAIVDASGNIVVMNPDGSNRVAITDRGGDPALYMQPVWSPDGDRLAWGQRTGTGFGIGIGRPEDGVTKALTTPNLPFYTYWSPNGRYLGALHNGDSGVQFQIVDVESETSELLDEDAPFYFSWSPEGDRVVTHAGVSRTQTLTPTGEREDLDPTSGTYLAPHWTPSGVFHVVDNQLMLENDRGERSPVAEVSGLTMFVSNPQGTRIALQTTGGSNLTASTEDFPIVDGESVVVVEVDTGTVEIVDNSLALGFFWSPDGEALLVLALSEGEVVPTVWRPDEGIRAHRSYRPSRSMLQNTFPFFPQYAQSVNFWSPDSTAFAFAGAVDGEDGIWVQHLEADAPTKIADGSWVAWSPSGD